jgi:hypothetical protein
MSQILANVGSVEELSKPSIAEEQLAAIKNRRLMDEQQKLENADKSIFGAALDFPATSYLTTAFESSRFPNDPTFSFTPERLLQYQKDYDLNDNELQAIASARSQDQADFLALEYTRRNESRRVLESAGWTGIAAQLAAEVVDPANIIIMMASAGLTVPGRVATFSNLVRNGLVNAAPMAAVEEFKASMDPNITQDQVLKNALGGGLFQIGVSRFANAKWYGRALAGGIGMATPSVAVDYMNGVETAEALKMASIQFAFGGIFGGISPRDTTVANRAVTNMAKDATKVHLELPPPPSRVIVPDAMPDMPPHLNENGYALLVDTMTENEKNVFALIFSYKHDVPERLVEALAGPNTVTGTGGLTGLRTKYNQLMEVEGLTPMAAISRIALELQTVEFGQALDLMPRTPSSRPLIGLPAPKERVFTVNEAGLVEQQPMPVSVNYRGFSLAPDQMSGNEKNAFALIFGFKRDMPQNVQEAINQLGGGEFVNRLRMKFFSLQRGKDGKNPLGALQIVANELQNLEVRPSQFVGGSPQIILVPTPRPALPPGGIRVGPIPEPRGRWQPRVIEMPSVLELEGKVRGQGEQTIPANLNDREFAVVQMVTGIGIPNPIIMEMASQALGVSEDRVQTIIRNRFQAQLNRGYKPNEIIRQLGEEFGVVKVRIEPPEQPIDIVAVQEAPDAAEVIRRELATESLLATQRSRTDRNSNLLEDTLDEGGDSLAVLTQNGAVPAGIEGMNTLTDGGSTLLSFKNIVAQVFSEFQELNAARVAKGSNPFTDKKLENMLGKVIEGMSKEDKALIIAFAKNNGEFDGLSEKQLRAIAEAAGIKESKIDGKTAKQLAKVLNDEVAVETPRAQRKRIQQLADAMTGGTTLQIPEITGAGQRLVDIDKLGQDAAARLRELNEPRVKAGKNPLGLKKATRIAEDLGAGDDTEVVARLAMADNDLTKLNLEQLKSIAKRAGIKPQAMRKMDEAAVIKMIQDERNAVRAARTAEPTAIPATEPQVIASTGILSKAEEVGDRLIRDGLNKLKGFGTRLRSGVDPEEITAAVQVLVGTVLKFGAKGLAKADVIIRMTIQRDMPSLVGQTDKLVALAKAALASGKNANGEFDVNTFVSNANAAQAASGAVTVDSNRGYDGFYPDMEEKGMSFLGAKWVPRLGKRLLYPFAHLMGASVDDDVRILGAALVTDFIPKHVNGVIQTAREGAYQWVTSKVEATQAFFKVTVNDLYQKYVKEAQASKVQPMTQEEFRRQIAYAARRPDDKSFSPAIRQAADSFRATVKRTLVVMAKHKVAGAEEVLKNMDDDWVRRMPDTNRVMQLRDKYGAEFINEMVYQSIIKAGSSDKVRRAIADAWVQNALGIGGGSAHLNMSPQTLYERVKAILPNASDKDLREIKNALLPGSDKDIQIGALRNRIWMDETKVHVAPNGDKLTLEELLVNDIDILMNRIAHTAYGAAAEQAILSDFGAKIGQEFTSSDDIIRYLKGKFAREGYSGSVDDMNDDIANLEIGFKLVRGYPVHTLDPKVNSYLAAVRNMNFISSMSNVASGITNYMEVGSGATQAGVNYFFQTYPEATRIFKEIVIDKQIDSKMAREMVAMGFGVNRVNRNLGVDIAHAGVVSSTLERFTAKGARLASDISLQSFGQDHLELATAMGLQQNLIDTAMTSGKIDFSEFKTRAMGWTDEDVGIIMQQLKKHADQTSEGVWAANLDKWDADASTQASKYASGIRMTVNRAIQKNDRSQLPLWFDGPLGKIAMQLKTFNYQATTNKLAFNLKGISNGDMTYAHDMVASSIMAGLGFTGAVYVRSMGMEEETKRQYFEDNLTMGRVLKAGFSRASWSGFVPSTVDTAMSMIGEAEVFSGMKNSTDIGNVVTGNMTFQQALAVSKIPKALRHWAHPDEYVTQPDMKAYAKAFWMPNIVFMRNYFNQLISDLPKRQPQPVEEEQ